MTTTTRLEQAQAEYDTQHDAYIILENAAYAAEAAYAKALADLENASATRSAVYAAIRSSEKTFNKAADALIMAGGTF